jgi:hypothetical protein
VLTYQALHAALLADPALDAGYGDYLTRRYFP